MFNIKSQADGLEQAGKLLRKSGITHEISAANY